MKKIEQNKLEHIYGGFAFGALITTIGAFLEVITNSLLNIKMLTSSNGQYKNNNGSELKWEESKNKNHSNKNIFTHIHHVN